MAENKIAFRRIRGRIIPIKQKRNQNLVSTGKLIGAGVATALVTGEGTAQITKGAATMRMLAKKKFRAAGGIFARAAKGYIGRSKSLKANAVLLRKGAMLLRKTRSPALLLGTITSAYLISEGLQKGHEAITGKRSGRTNEYLSTVAGTVAAGAIGTLYYRRLGLGLGQALRTAKAARGGNPYKYGTIPIKTRHGTLKFSGPKQLHFRFKTPPSVKGPA